MTHCWLGAELLQPSRWLIQRMADVDPSVLQSERTLNEWQRKSLLQLLLPRTTQFAAVVQTPSTSTFASQLQCTDGMQLEVD
jgi:hypothetical protein